MTVTGPSPPSLPALAVPGEGRGLPVPVAGRLLEPGADLGRAARLLPVERPALEDALDRFGHVQPAAAQGRVERHDAVPAQPQLMAACSSMIERKTAWCTDQACGRSRPTPVRAQATRT